MAFKFRRRTKTRNRTFKKFAKPHKKNRTRLQFRGGIRL